MESNEKQRILEAAKSFVRERIAPNHIKNTKKLSSLENFNINPFLEKYLAQFAFGDATAKSMARVLIYARALGTSISTSFGTNMQYFCNDVLSSFASTTSGIDIEYIDVEDGQRKYCQVKAGPNTINKDDVPVIKDHFRGVMNLGRTNGLRITTADCVVGVLYGTSSELSSHYKKIAEDYPVIIGEDFWYHLTGDRNFYTDLIDAFAEVAEEFDSSDLVEQTIQALAQKIDEQE